MKKTLMLLVVSLSIAVSGCAGLSQAVAAKEKAGKVAVQAANDNIVDGISDSLCALPYGTLLRHPEIQSAALSVCPGAMNSPNLLSPSKNLTTPADVSNAVTKANVDPSAVDSPVK